MQRQYYYDECLDWLLNTVLIYMVLTGIMQKDILVNKHKYKKNNLALFPFFSSPTDWSSVFSGFLRFFLKLSQTCWERERSKTTWNNPNTSLKERWHGSRLTPCKKPRHKLDGAVGHGLGLLRASLQEDMQDFTSFTSNSPWKQLRESSGASHSEMWWLLHLALNPAACEWLLC